MFSHVPSLGVRCSGKARGCERVVAAPSHAGGSRGTASAPHKSYMSPVRAGRAARLGGPMPGQGAAPYLPLPLNLCRCEILHH